MKNSTRGLLMSLRIGKTSIAQNFSKNCKCSCLLDRLQTTQLNSIWLRKSWFSCSVFQRSIPETTLWYCLTAYMMRLTGSRRLHSDQSSAASASTLKLISLWRLETTTANLRRFSWAFQRRHLCLKFISLSLHGIKLSNEILWWRTRNRRRFKLILESSGSVAFTTGV